MNKKLGTLAAVMILLVIVMGVGKCSAQSPYQIDSTINKVLIEYNVAPFTRTLIISQARVESGVYTNNLYRKHCNLFGMRHPRVRPTKSLGALARAEGRKGYASFATIEDSVIDLVLWLTYVDEFRAYDTSREYVTTLKLHGYFGSNKEVYLKNILHHNIKQKQDAKDAIEKRATDEDLFDASRWVACY